MEYGSRKICSQKKKIGCRIGHLYRGKNKYYLYPECFFLGPNTTCIPDVFLWQVHRGKKIQPVSRTATETVAE